MLKAWIHKTNICFLLIPHLIWLTSCRSNSQKQPQQTTQQPEAISCEQRLQALIEHSSWKSAFKQNFKAEIESTEGKTLRVQLSTPKNDGTHAANTIGWMVIDEDKKTLNDITNDLENPEKISYQPSDWNRFLSCYRKNSGNPSSPESVLQLSDLFKEGSNTSFSPVDLNKNNSVIKQFKVKLTRFEQQHTGNPYLSAEDLSVLINNEIFDNSNTYVNSSWLAYFLNKYNISPDSLNAAFNQAITQEDYEAVKIMLRHGFIVSAQQLKEAKQTKDNSVRLIKYNLNNNGLDESGDPTFYNHKKSRIEEILQLINSQYQANIIQDNDGFTNLRESKTKTSKVIRQIKNAEHVNVLDNSGEWWMVETVDGERGYVFWTRIKSGVISR